LLGIYAAARIHSMITFRAAMRSLEENNRVEIASAPETAGPALPADSSLAADRSLWSEERIRAYQRSTIKRAGTPLAILRIPKLQLEVPVLEGTDRITLNSGAGRIAGTALPGEHGNIGIAGHRDGFFRGLKDISKGDTIELVANHHTDTYVVDNIHITSPDDVSVLQPSRRSQLTLVTCYPFYFVGPAPKRYIVQALLKQ
jgi:sortase A